MRPLAGLGLSRIHGIQLKPAVRITRKGRPTGDMSSRARSCGLLNQPATVQGHAPFPLPCICFFWHAPREGVRSSLYSGVSLGSADVKAPCLATFDPTVDLGRESMRLTTVEDPQRQVSCLYVYHI
jgi:hypothetical protein